MASDVTAVRIVSEFRSRRNILEYLGSAHFDEEVAKLMAGGAARLLR